MGVVVGAGTGAGAGAGTGAGAVTVTVTVTITVGQGLPRVLVCHHSRSLTSAGVRVSYFCFQLSHALTINPVGDFSYGLLGNV